MCWRHTKLRFGSEISREKNHLSRRVYFPVQLETRRDLARSSYFLVSLVVSGGHCGKYSQLVRWVGWEKTSLVSTTSSRYRRVLSWRYRYLFSQGPSKSLPFIMSVWVTAERFSPIHWLKLNSLMLPSDAFELDPKVWERQRSYRRLSVTCRHFIVLLLAAGLLGK